MSGGERTALLNPAIASEQTAPKSGGSTNHDDVIAKGVVWQGSMRWLVQILSWTATLVIARRLSPEDYGIAGTATVLVGLLSQITDAGVGRALMMRREKQTEVLEQAFSASAIIGCIAALLVLGGALPMAYFYSEPRVAPLIALLALLPIISGLSAVPLAVLQQQLRYRAVALIEFSKAFVQAIVVLVCAVGGLRYWSLAIGTLVGNIVALIIARQYIKIRARRPDLSLLRPTLRYAMHLVVAAMSWYLYSNSDFVVVGRTAGIVALGYYQFAWNVAQLPGEKLGNILQSVVGPFFATIGDDRDSLRHYFVLLSEFLMAVMLPVLCGFAIVSPIAVPLLFGAKWLAAVPAMQILVMCAAISAVSLLGQHVLTATGQADVSMKLSVGTLFTLPLAFFIAAKIWGPFAVACVWLIAQPVLVGVILSRVRDTLDLPVRRYLLQIRAPFVCSALMVGALALVRPFTSHLPPVLQLATLSLIGATLYITAFRTLYGERVTAIVAVLRRRKT